MQNIERLTIEVVCRFEVEEMWSIRDVALDIED